MPYLRAVLEDREEDAMCRHEAAEALGALGFEESLGLLRALRDDSGEVVVVRETCDIAVERIEWEHSEARKVEMLKMRYVLLSLLFSTTAFCNWGDWEGWGRNVMSI